jgi:hypothetical protein
VLKQDRHKRPDTEKDGAIDVGPRTPEKLRQSIFDSAHEQEFETYESSIPSSVPRAQAPLTPPGIPGGVSLAFHHNPNHLKGDVAHELNDQR